MRAYLSNRLETKAHWQPISSPHRTWNSDPSEPNVRKNPDTTYFPTDVRDFSDVIYHRAFDIVDPLYPDPFPPIIYSHQ